MSKINTLATGATTIQWVQKNQEEIKAHPAWHEHISENESEALLKGKTPFTYLLRTGGKEHSYFISFIKEDFSIKHQFFVLEIDKKGWCYRNGTTVNHPTEIVSQDLNELIPLMMHCECNECIGLTNKNAIV